MKFAFRADASLQIGTGHIMRCLTLAKALKDHGHTCLFICRELDGHLIPKIIAQGFDVRPLPKPQSVGTQPRGPAHAHWAEVSWQQDAEETANELAAIQPDWLVLDHYAFDAGWERVVLGRIGARLCVIDDLADRPHLADCLIDQGLGNEKSDYRHLVSKDCQVMVGPKYALLRPEFSKLRSRVMGGDKDRLLRSGVSSILVSIGGVDLKDLTSFTLRALEKSAFPSSLQVTIVVGGTAPNVKSIAKLCKGSRFRSELLVDHRDMAGLMANADFAIGAAGSTSWERCCLGLPSLLMSVASNQQKALQALGSLGACDVFDPDCDSDASGRFVRAVNKFANCPEKLKSMGTAAAAVTDGKGTQRVMECLEGA